MKRAARSVIHTLMNYNYALDCDPMQYRPCVKLHQSNSTGLVARMQACSLPCLVVASRRLPSAEPYGERAPE